MRFAVKPVEKVMRSGTMRLSVLRSLLKLSGRYSSKMLLPASKKTAALTRKELEEIPVGEKRVLTDKGLRRGLSRADANAYKRGWTVFYTRISRTSPDEVFVEDIFRYDGYSAVFDDGTRVEIIPDLYNSKDIAIRQVGEKSWQIHLVFENPTWYSNSRDIAIWRAEKLNEKCFAVENAFRYYYSKKSGYVSDKHVRLIFYTRDGALRQIPFFRCKLCKSLLVLKKDLRRAEELDLVAKPVERRKENLCLECAVLRKLAS